jgi:hypothetical protein
MLYSFTTPPDGKTEKRKIHPKTMKSGWRFFKFFKLKFWCLEFGSRSQTNLSG